jgi:3-keto-disaccharide hydrolase
MLRIQFCIAICLTFFSAQIHAEDQKLNVPPKGFKALFNGTDLTGWKGLVGSPKSRAEMSADDLAAAQKTADQQMRDHWSVADGILTYDGKGQSLCTAKDYRNFEMYVDWLIRDEGDSGIYLRGSPQVQIWDPKKWNGIGSGGLYNNQKNPSKPTVTADKPIGEWNHFKIKMVDQKVWVWLNDQLVVDGVILENYWERDKPIYKTGQIELQHHGDTLKFRNVFIRELNEEGNPL